MSELLIKICIYVIVVVFLCILLIKRFVYFRPSRTFLPTEETYKNIQHRHLHGWFLERSIDVPVILFCHSNTGNISYCQRKTKMLYNLGYSILIFDYSGYGKSSGVPSEQQLYDDASIMMSLLLQTYSPEKIVLYGEAMGAAIATYVAIRYRIPTLILDSPLPCISVIAHKILRKAKILAFPFNEFNVETYLRGYKGRTLLFHSINDEVIPYNTTTTLQTLADIVVPCSGTHNSIELPIEEIKKFINL